MVVVAEKYPRKRAFIVILVASVMLIVIGFALACAGAFVDNYPDALDYIGLALILIGVACTVMMIITLVRYCRLPNELITYENGILTFPKGSCRADEVDSVSCTETKPNYKSVSYDFGFGIVTAEVNGTKLKAYYAANPAETCEKLREIVREARLLK